MSGFLSLVVLAAEAGGQAPPAAPGPQPGAGAGIWTFLPFLLIVVAFFWFTSRAQKKREQKRQEMLGSIKVKDDVVTIGGIYGRVVQVRDDEFVLRVDEEKDVKITVARNGVSRRVGEAAPE